MVSQNKTVRLHKLWLRTQETGLSFISYHTSRTTPPWILPGKERSQNHNLSPLRGGTFSSWGNCHGDSISSPPFTSMFSVYTGMLTSANTCAHPLYPIVKPLEMLVFSLITVDPSLLPCHCFSTVPYLRVNSVYWWKSVRPSGVLWVLDSVVLTDEGTWPEAANHHAVPSVCGCECGCWSQRSASRFTKPTKKKIDVLWQPQNFK